MWQEYYEKQLYPLQNKVFEILNIIPVKFYLTGGTALSRVYCRHRYSDDLDFFVNQDSDFESETQTVFQNLRANFDDVVLAISYDTFARCFVTHQEIQLKIEFVNDVLFRVGDTQETPLFKQMDNIENILSNKICALSRDAPKDIADIWFIALNFEFNWAKAIENAKNKDLWVDESQVLIILEQFDLQRLSEVKWIVPFDLYKAQEDMKIILQDVLFGRDNSLYKKPE